MASIPNLTPEILSYLQNGSEEPLLEEDVVLILRNSHAGGISCNGFQWPEEGAVEAKDWNPIAVCGYGLHGFKWGEGDGCLAKWEFDAVWQVVAVSGRDLVDLGEKVKFPRGWVMYSGTQEEATRRIAECAPLDSVIIGRIASVGDNQSVTVGYGGTATAGYNGRATAGNRGTAKTGNYGKSIVGYGSTAVAGDYGHAIAGKGGIAISGYCGTAMSGFGGRATAGDFGTLSIDWYDSKKGRMMISVGYVGIDGIKANVQYKLDGEGNFVEVEEELPSSEEENLIV